jgi:hypothetical protein
MKEYAVIASKAQDPAWQTTGGPEDDSYVNEDLMESPTEKKDASSGSTLVTIPFTFKPTGTARTEVATPTSATVTTTLATK